MLRRFAAAGAERRAVPYIGNANPGRPQRRMTTFFTADTHIADAHILRMRPFPGA